MKNEDAALELLEELVRLTHKHGNQHEAWDDEYEYIAIDYEGPYIDDDTQEQDHDCVMYLINIDTHLQKRLKSADKFSMSQDYATLYGWITPSTNSVDIVGMDNLSKEDRDLLVANVNSFIVDYWKV